MICIASGLEARHIGSIQFLTASAPPSRAELQDLAKDALRRLSLLQLPASIPLPESLFETRAKIKFSALGSEQQAYLRKVVDFGWLGRSPTDLGPFTVEFANTIWFQGWAAAQPDAEFGYEIW